jgi:hypothetical protein
MVRFCERILAGCSSTAAETRDHPDTDGARQRQYRLWLRQRRICRTAARAEFAYKVVRSPSVFLPAVATPLQIRRLAAHFVQNRPEIGERVRPTHGANWRRSMQLQRVRATLICWRCVGPLKFLYSQNLQRCGPPKQVEPFLLLGGFGRGNRMSTQACWLNLGLSLRGLAGFSLPRPRLQFPCSIAQKLNASIKPVRFTLPSP